MNVETVLVVVATLAIAFAMQSRVFAREARRARRRTDVAGRPFSNRTPR